MIYPLTHLYHEVALLLECYVAEAAAQCAILPQTHEPLAARVLTKRSPVAAAAVAGYGNEMAAAAATATAAAASCCDVCWIVE